jgi:hypothetical protein
MIPISKGLKALALSATVALTVGFAAAAAPPAPNPIDRATRDGLSVRDVVVDWQADDSKAAGDPDYPAHKAEMIQSLTAAVRDQFQYSPYGPNAVALHIKLKSFHRYEVIGDVSVVRIADQAELGTYEKIDGFYLGVVTGGGLSGALIGLSSVPDSTPGTANCFAARLRARFNDLPRPACGSL